MGESVRKGERERAENVRKKGVRGESVLEGRVCERRVCARGKGDSRRVYEGRKSESVRGERV